VVENLKKFFVPPGRKILLDFVVEKPHKFVNAEAGPTMAADEEEEEYERLANDPSLAGYARELSAQITWDAHMEDFMLDVVVLLGAYTGGGLRRKSLKRSWRASTQSLLPASRMLYLMLKSPSSGDGQRSCQVSVAILVLRRLSLLRTQN
jgi:hypothetical protein